jgi:hypothetical protein
MFRESADKLAPTFGYACAVGGNWSKLLEAAGVCPKGWAILCCWYRRVEGVAADAVAEQLFDNIICHLELVQLPYN